MATSPVLAQSNVAQSNVPQSAAPANSYDPRLTFAPLTLPDPVNTYRSSDGAPGPGYWQNRADYELHAALDTAQKSLAATETITYTNNSPDNLTELWVQLDQNIYRKDSRAHLASGGVRRGRPGAAQPAGPAPSTEGFVLDDVQVEAGKQTSKPETLVSDTRLQVRLSTPLAPKGGQLKLHIRYHYTIPGPWGGRTSWGHFQAGRHLRHRPVVPAHGRLRRPPRLGHPALHRLRVLPRIRPLRLLPHRPRKHDRRRLRRAREPERRPHQNRTSPPRPGPQQRHHRLHSQTLRSERPRLATKVQQPRRHPHLALRHGSTPATSAGAPRPPSSGTPPASTCPTANPPSPKASTRPNP